MSTSKKECSGDGLCLQQTDYLNKYIRDKDISCKHLCVAQKCPNFLICKTLNPQWVLLCHSGLCVSCNTSFGKWKGGKGKLIFYNDKKCPRCSKVGKWVSRPKCEHVLCLKCFKRLMNGPKVDPIKFPYDEATEEEYYESNEIKKFENDPKIKSFELEDELREDFVQFLFENEKNLRKCITCKSSFF